MNIELLEITPKMAAEFLSRNKKNRTVNQTAVAEYAREMAEGRWQFSGDSIRFDTQGNMLDGQHRCLASIESGKSFHSIVVTGLIPETQNVMDTGRKRSLSNALSIAGEKDTAALAAVTALVYAWEKGLRGANLRSANKVSASIQVYMDYFYENAEDLRFATAEGKKLASAVPTGIRAAGLAAWVLYKLDAEDAQAFLQSLAVGANLSENDPIFVLRNRLFQEKKNVQSAHSLVADFTLALIFKGWNFWRSGAEISLLKYKLGGANKEAFPEPK